MDTRLEIRLDQDLLDRIDSTRGIASRSAWIRFALERAVETSGDGSVWLRPAVAESSHKPVPEEAPAAAPRATESRERPAPPRGQGNAALARQQALNKSKFK